MNNIERVYNAIKEHNAKSPILNGLQTSPVVAHTGDITKATGLTLDEVHLALKPLIESGRVIMKGEPLRSTGRNNYGEILNYPGLFAV